MGLDCYVHGGTGGGRIGSYTGVHTLRSHVLKAALKYYLQKIRLGYHRDCADILSTKVPRTIATKIVQYLEDPSISIILSLKMNINNEDIWDDEDLQKWDNILSSYTLLNSWTKKEDGFGCFINYKKINATILESNSDKLCCLYLTNMIGVYKFINHSDADGFFSYGDCQDIVVAFNKIAKYIPDEISEWFLRVQSYYQDAVDQKESLVYC